MSAKAFQITGVSIVCWTVCSGAVWREHQRYASLALVKGIHRSSVDSLHRGQWRGALMFSNSNSKEVYCCTRKYISQSLWRHSVHRGTLPQSITTMISGRRHDTAVHHRTAQMNWVPGQNPRMAKWYKLDIVIVPWDGASFTNKGPFY